jgi:PAS domain S-box-containing protein
VAPVAVASLDLEGRIIDANPALLSAAGYTLDELAGRPYYDFFADEGSRQSFMSLAAGALETYRAECLFRVCGGEVKETNVSVALVRDAAGQPESCLAVVEDVTRYKQAIRDAQRRTAELEAVIESMPAAVLIGDASGVKMANGTALAHFGFHSADEMNSGFSAMAAQVRARDVETDKPFEPDEYAFSRALRGEQVNRVMKVTHLRTGKDVIQHVIAAPVKEDGRIVGAVAVLVDVASLYAAEDALRLSETRYRELVAQSPMSIQILSPDGRTLHVNPAWERLWGLSSEAVRDYNMLEDPQLVDRGLMPFIKQAFAGTPAVVPASLYDPDRTLDSPSTHADSRRWVSAFIYPIKGSDDRVREVVLMHQDITEQMLAEEERRHVESEREALLISARHAHREAEEAGRVKDEFLALLSHELRTPLNAVLGWARILRTRPMSEQTAHAVAVIERNASAQARLIDDLLDVSSIITGKIRLQLEMVEIGALAAGAIEAVRPAAEARRIRIDLRIAGGLPSVAADPERLQQVFWNLLSNAVKFTEPGGTVAVTVEMEGASIKGEVRDTGIGIAPKVLPFIFERFTQADSSSTRAHAGLGLGLAIARHVVELHGGTIAAASPGLGQGTTITFRLPVVAL